MAFFAHVSFYPVPTEPEVYERIKTGLASLGLYSALVGQTKDTATLPLGTFGGEFKGESADKVKGDIAQRVCQVLAQNGVVGALLISVGDDWSWGFRPITAASVAQTTPA